VLDNPWSSSSRNAIEGGTHNVEGSEPFLVCCFFERLVVAVQGNGVQQADAAGEVEGCGPVFVAFVDAASMARTF